jgi:hypothetical protein
MLWHVWMLWHVRPSHAQHGATYAAASRALLPRKASRVVPWHPGQLHGTMALGREGTNMVMTEATLHQRWRPRAIVRVPIPLLLVLILAWVDKQWVVRKGSYLYGWRDPAHYHSEHQRICVQTVGQTMMVVVVSVTSL